MSMRMIMSMRMGTILTIVRMGTREKPTNVGKKNIAQIS